MIVVAGLTPAWQQIMIFNPLRLDQVNRATEVHWCASGKAINCGLALHRLGADCCTISPAGGINGKAMKEDFQQTGATARWLESKINTRVCTTVISQGAQTTTVDSITELVENSQPMPTQELEDYRNLFQQVAQKAELLILTGSLPEQTPDSYYHELLSSLDCPTLLDYRGPGLVQSLTTQPFLVKPNREELETTLGRKLEEDQELLAGMRELNQQGAEWVLITTGDGPVYLASKEESYRYSPLSVPVVNAIGCGDCFTAGIAWAIQSGKSIVEAVPFGIAAASDNLQQLLPAQLDSERVTQLAGQVQWEKWK